MRRGHRKHPWTAEDDARMRAEFAHMRTLDLARAMGRTIDSLRSRAVLLGLRKTSETRARIDADRSYPNGNAGKFHAAQEPWNKGKSDYRRATGAPLGTERTRGPYRQRKVCMDGPYHRRWRFVHVLLWEAAHGPVPTGHKLRFRDGDATHVSLDNLALVTDAENLAPQSAQAYGAELFQLIQLRGQITRQLNKRKAKA